MEHSALEVHLKTWKPFGVPHGVPTPCHLVLDFGQRPERKTLRYRLGSTNPYPPGEAKAHKDGEWGGRSGENIGMGAHLK